MSGSWSADMRRIRGLTEEKMAKVLRVAVLATAKDIIMDTPVDEGRLRANWQIGVDNKPSGQLNVFDKSGNVTLSRVNGALTRVTSHSKVYFVNNLPYAYPIEFGHSRVKAPRGMVRKNVAKWKSRVEKIARQVKNES